MTIFKLVLALLVAAACVCVAPTAMAWGNHGHHHGHCVPDNDHDDDDDDDDEEGLDVAVLRVELNNTDEDLGIHADIDGEPWKKLKIEDPCERRMLSVRVKGRLRKQGLTEFSFESAEPTFDELTPEEFFKRFPEGEYEISAKTLEHEKLENDVFFSHVLPAPVSNIMVNNVPLPENCDEELPVIVADRYMVTWDLVETSHPEIGKWGDPEVELYEVVTEIDDSPFKGTQVVPPDVNKVLASSAVIGDNEEIKIEILVQSANGNRVAVETCFLTRKEEED